MSDKYHYIAVDLGAESGRVMLASVGIDNISLEQVHRFPNGPVERNGSVHWNFTNLLSQIKAGIKKAVSICPEVQSIGVDTWGVDFGLIDTKGCLIEDPYHYRDSRTDGILEKAFDIIPKKEIYSNTGIQFMQFNSLYQLLAYKKSKGNSLDKTKNLLFMADLVSYFLTGTINAEFTMASTSQMMDMKTGTWSKKIIDTFKIPTRILPRIIRTGTIIASLTESIAQELNCRPIPVIAVGSHDTASAVAAVPADKNSSWAYLSSGTWSLLGTEIDAPIINDKSFELDFTNEGGVENTIRLLKNIMGLWLVQQCKSHWADNGVSYEYLQLTEMAQNAQPFQALIDCQNQNFLSPGNMPKKINDYLTSTKQQAIDDHAQMIRVILESLALRYSQVLEMLEELIQKKIDKLHVVGGGSKNQFLNQLTADATGTTVLAGPVEATVLGNCLIQAIALGHIKSLSAGRKLIARSFDIEKYLPADTEIWASHKKRFAHIK